MGTMLQEAQAGSGGADAAMTDLAAALEEENAIVQDLYDTLLRQRAGVAADDGPAVELSVNAVSRLLLTLHEARRRRGRLIETLTGDPRLTLDELERAAGAVLPPAVAAARERLRGSARNVAREVAINRAVLERAVESGEAFLHELFATAAGPSPVYGARDRRDERDAGAGMLLDRKV